MPTEAPIEIAELARKVALEDYIPTPEEFDLAFDALRQYREETTATKKQKSTINLDATLTNLFGPKPDGNNPNGNTPDA